MRSWQPVQILLKPKPGQTKHIVCLVSAQAPLMGAGGAEVAPWEDQGGWGRGSGEGARLPAQNPGTPWLLAGLTITGLLQTQDDILGIWDGGERGALGIPGCQTWWCPSRTMQGVIAGGWTPGQAGRCSNQKPFPMLAQDPCPGCLLLPAPLVFFFFFVGGGTTSGV